jgi:hypothetical protein
MQELHAGGGGVDEEKEEDKIFFYRVGDKEITFQCWHKYFYTII